MLAGWGDSYLVSEDSLNTSYDSSNYESYSDQTRKNLVLCLSSWSLCFSYSPFWVKYIASAVVDYDLLEELICHIDDTCEEGAILVFLPVSW